MMPNMVGAIDGENVSFAIAGAGPELRLEAVRHFKTSEFPTFTDALQRYTREQQLSTKGLELGLAVAGVAKGDVISQANCRWYISVSGLRAFLAAEPLILNDFAAIAWSVASATAGRLKPIGAAMPRAVSPGRTFLVVGTGSGLGAATLVSDESGAVTVMGSEGGHCSFSPQNAREDALLAALRKKHGHVSFERLLSASGLQSIYAWIGERDGQAVPAPEAPKIVTAALSRRDPRSVEALEIFTEILGSFAGNAVLSAGAFDGVFLVSPLLGAVLPAIQGTRFRSAFTGKGRMKKMLDPVPTSFVPDEDGPLYGTARALLSRRGSQRMALAA
jgi:glucokinase